MSVRCIKRKGAKFIVTPQILAEVFNRSLLLECRVCSDTFLIKESLPKRCPCCYTELKSAYPSIVVTNNDQREFYAKFFFESFVKQNPFIKPVHKFDIDNVFLDIRRFFNYPFLLKIAESNNKDDILEALICCCREPIRRNYEGMYAVLEEAITNYDYNNSISAIKFLSFHDLFCFRKKEIRKLSENLFYEKPEWLVSCLIEGDLLSQDRQLQILSESYSLSRDVQEHDKSLEYANSILLLEAYWVSGIIPTSILHPLNSYTNTGVKVGGFKFNTKNIEKAKNIGLEFQKKLIAKRHKRNGIMSKIRSFKQMQQSRKALKKAVDFHRYSPNSSQLHKKVGKMYQKDKKNESFGYPIIEAFWDGSPFQVGKQKSFFFKGGKIKVLGGKTNKGINECLIKGMVYYKEDKARNEIEEMVIVSHNCFLSESYKRDIIGKIAKEKAVRTIRYYDSAEDNLLLARQKSLIENYVGGHGCIYDVAVSEKEKLEESAILTTLLSYGGSFLKAVASGAASGVTILGIDTLIIGGFVPAVLMRLWTKRHLITFDSPKNILVINNFLNTLGGSFTVARVGTGSMVNPERIRTLRKDVIDVLRYSEMFRKQEETQEEEIGGKVVTVKKIKGLKGGFRSIEVNEFYRAVTNKDLEDYFNTIVGIRTNIGLLPSQDFKTKLVKIFDNQKENKKKDIANFVSKCGIRKGSDLFYETCGAIVLLIENVSFYKAMTFGFFASLFFTLAAVGVTGVAAVSVFKKFPNIFKWLEAKKEGKNPVIVSSTEGDPKQKLGLARRMSMGVAGRVKKILKVVVAWLGQKSRFYRLRNPKKFINGLGGQEFVIGKNPLICMKSTIEARVLTEGKKFKIVKIISKDNLKEIEKKVVFNESSPDDVVVVTSDSLAGSAKDSKTGYAYLTDVYSTVVYSPTFLKMPIEEIKKSSRTIIGKNKYIGNYVDKQRTIKKFKLPIFGFKIDGKSAKISLIKGDTYKIVRFVGKKKTNIGGKFETYDSWELDVYSKGYSGLAYATTEHLYGVLFELAESFSELSFDKTNISRAVQINRLYERIL